MIDLNIKLIPRSSKNKIVGWQADDRLKIKVTAPPVDGKANATLIAFLAKEFKVPKTSIEIIRGKTIPEKTLQFRSLDAQELKNRLPHPS